MPEPTIAVLDVDGTLVDSNYQHALAWYRALRAMGETFPIWRLHRLIGMGGDQLVLSLGGEELEERIGEEARKRQGEEGDAVIGEVAALPGARDPRPAAGEQGGGPPAGARQLRQAAARRRRGRPARRPGHRRRDHLQRGR